MKVVRAGTPVAVVTAILTLSALQPVFGNATAPEGGGPSTEKPKLVLKAEPRIGFSPLRLTLRAVLSGVSSDDLNFCHVDQLWLGKRSDSPGARERASAHRPRCHHPDDKKQVEMVFFKDLNLYSPGAYIYRLKLEPKQGPPLISNPVTLRVLRR